MASAFHVKTQSQCLAVSSHKGMARTECLDACGSNSTLCSADICGFVYDLPCFMSETDYRESLQTGVFVEFNWQLPCATKMPRCT